MTDILKDLITRDRPFLVVCFDKPWVRVALDVYFYLKFKGLSSATLEAILGTLQSRMDLAAAMDDGQKTRWGKRLGTEIEFPNFETFSEFDIITTERFEGLTFSAVCSLAMNSNFSRYITAAYYKELYFNEVTSNLRPVEVQFGGFSEKLDLLQEASLSVYPRDNLDRADSSKMVILEEHLFNIYAKITISNLLVVYPDSKPLQECLEHYMGHGAHEKNCFSSRVLDIESLIALGLVDLTSAYILLAAVDRQRYSDRMPLGDEKFVVYVGPDKLTIALDENGIGVLI